MNIGKHLLIRPLNAALYRSQNPSRFLSSANSYKYIKVEQKGTDNRVSVITLNRPEVLNALSIGIIDEIVDALSSSDSNPEVAANVLTGNEKSFSVGADIQEASERGPPEVHIDEFQASWVKLENIKKPMIAAVNGYALGGGCELTMVCDIIYAGEKAKFGQPEIKIGVIPGAGGTQRLARFIGKSRAMEMCLSGEMINAQEALKLGLVSKVFPDGDVVAEAINLADKIGEFSKPAVEMCKASVNSAFQTNLSEGLQRENQFFKKIFTNN